MKHEFRYRLFMAYLDLAELPELIAKQRLFGASRHSASAFYRNDHLFDDRRPIEDEARDIIAQQLGHRPTGPIRLLTQLRHFRFYFSPLNLFFVFDRFDQEVEAVLAEVNNTPWRQRHCYVLWSGNRKRHGNSRLSFVHAKDFHVSPFMGMDQTYRWDLSQPNDFLHVHLASGEQTDRMFDARMSLQRRELSREQLSRMQWRYPLITAKISAAIYYQAFKLWWKRCPFFPHPQRIKYPAMIRN
ncbi:MAG: DUF1365 domain-containing protein [Pirellulales bacterium]|nr:DUF1365 domain-containing protein [Pirellulales bacterium]